MSTLLLLSPPDPSHPEHYVPKDISARLSYPCIPSYQEVSKTEHQTRKSCFSPVSVCISFLFSPVEDMLQATGDFPGGSASKASAYLGFNRGDLGFNPWVGKLSQRRKWQLAPGSLPRKSHGWRSLVATVHGATKSQIRLSDFTFFLGYWPRYLQ